MPRILVTGSTDGIGAKVGELLSADGHSVVFHARTEARAGACSPLPSGAEVVVGDFASLQSVRTMATELCAREPLDVIVHNAGWASHSSSRQLTEDGLEQTFQVNTLAPYLLTALLPLPRRLVFVSSDSIVRAHIDLSDLQHEESWTGDAAYADSKLAVAGIALALARRHPMVRSNAVHPGWVRTKMSNYEAPLDVAEGADTPVWLATSDEDGASVSGAFLQGRKQVRLNEQLYDEKIQDGLLDACAALCDARLG